MLLLVERECTAGTAGVPAYLDLGQDAHGISKSAAPKATGAGITYPLLFNAVV
jgi:hypothetical protein